MDNPRFVLRLGDSVIGIVKVNNLPEEEWKYIIRELEKLGFVVKSTYYAEYLLDAVRILFEPRK